MTEWSLQAGNLQRGCLLDEGGAIAGLDLKSLIRLMGEIDDVIPSWPAQSRPTGTWEQCFGGMAASV
jgi:hypothetical protein